MWHIDYCTTVKLNVDVFDELFIEQTRHWIFILVQLLVLKLQTLTNTWKRKLRLRPYELWERAWKCWSNISQMVGDLTEQFLGSKTGTCLELKLAKQTHNFHHEAAVIQIITKTSPKQPHDISEFKNTNPSSPTLCCQMLKPSPAQKYHSVRRDAADFMDVITRLEAKKTTSRRVVLFITVKKGCEDLLLYPLSLCSKPPRYVCTVLSLSLSVGGWVRGHLSSCHIKCLSQPLYFN